MFPSIVYILVVEINHEVVDKPVLVVMPTNTNSFRNKKEELFSHRVSQSHDCIVKKSVLTKRRSSAWVREEKIYVTE